MFKVLSQPDALFSIGFVLDEYLIYLSHLDATFDLLNLDITFV